MKTTRNRTEGPAERIRRAVVAVATSVATGAGTGALLAHKPLVVRVDGRRRR